MSWVFHHVRMQSGHPLKDAVHVLSPRSNYVQVVHRGLSRCPRLTWMMLCMWGMRRSMRTSSNMTRARHTFFRTSESSSAASANKL